MNKPTLLAAALWLALTGTAGAQTATPSAPVPPKPSATAVTGQGQGADHIVALVNSEPITSQEVRARLAQIELPKGPNAPSRADVARQVLERLIIEKTQVQWALETGVKVDDAAVQQMQDNIARQNRMSVAQLEERLKAMGQSPAAFRANLRNELLMQRLREREVDNRVKVSEQDIDAHLSEQLAGGTPLELNLAQVLIPVPENASPETVAQQLALAQKVEQRARAGEDFAALAREFSASPEGKTAGGQLGVRNADRYPNLFLDATQSLKTGGISAPVRSGAGFHVLKVVEKRQGGLPDSHYTQTRARHILLQPSVKLSQDAAIAKLNELRQRIERGQARFEDLAREFSQDGSAREGGDLGWANPGQFVPEFEQAMTALAPNQISQPLVSRFGVHLIQVLERREAELTAREQREVVRNQLREQKTAETYEEWARELRARAYVEYREPPQ